MPTMNISSLLITSCLLVVVTFAACPPPDTIPRIPDNPDSGYNNPIFIPPDDNVVINYKFTLILAASKNKTYCDSPHLFVYRGSDPTRRWKDFYRCDNSLEAKYLEKYCDKIFTYFNDNNGIKLEEVMQFPDDSLGKWRILPVTVLREGEAIKKYFCFLNVKGEYALADIRDSLD